MNTFYTVMGWIAILYTVIAYIYLIYFFISEEVYSDMNWFDVLILLSGPIGFTLLYGIGLLNHDDLEEEDEELF
jgi:hypothetical protein